MQSVSMYELKLVKTGERKVQNSAISNPADAAVILETIFELEAQAEEVMVMMFLNTKHKVTGATIVSRGHLNASLVHPREVFKRACLANAAAIIIGHNHPSGDPIPSSEDIAITKRLSEAGEIMGIPVLDHIVTGEDGNYISLKERGLM